MERFIVAKEVCWRCGGRGWVDDERERIYYETDTVEEFNLVDFWHRIPCPVCRCDDADEDYYRG